MPSSKKRTKEQKTDFSRLDPMMIDPMMTFSYRPATGRVWLVKWMILTEKLQKRDSRVRPE